MKAEQLFDFFDIHKNGKIIISVTDGDITLEDLFRMFKLKMEKESDAVHMD